MPVPDDRTAAHRRPRSPRAGHRRRAAPSTGWPTTTTPGRCARPAAPGRPPPATGVAKPCVPSRPRSTITSCPCRVQRLQLRGQRLPDAADRQRPGRGSARPAAATVALPGRTAAQADPAARAGRSAPRAARGPGARPLRHDEVDDPLVWGDGRAQVAGQDGARPARIGVHQDRGASARLSVSPSADVETPGAPPAEASAMSAISRTAGGCPGSRPPSRSPPTPPARGASVRRNGHVDDPVARSPHRCVTPITTASMVAGALSPTSPWSPGVRLPVPGLRCAGPLPAVARRSGSAPPPTCPAAEAVSSVAAPAGSSPPAGRSTLARLPTTALALGRRHRMQRRVQADPDHHQVARP